MSVQMKKTLLFLALTFAVSWGMAGAFLALGGAWRSAGAFALTIAYMFVPALMAIVVQKAGFHEGVVRPLQVSFRLNWWFLAAWLLPLVLGFLTFGIGLLLPGVQYSPDFSGFIEHFRGMATPEQLERLRRQMDVPLAAGLLWAVLSGLVAGATINAVAGFGEELGWRGFLLKQLAELGFWRSALLIGLIWGLWHAPLILQGHNYPQHPVLGVGMMTVWTLLLAPIFSYVRLRARSVIAAAVLHGTLNAAYGIPLLLIRGGSDLTIGLTGAAGFIALAIANLALVVYDRFFAREPLMGREGICRLLETPAANGRPPEPLPPD